MAGGVTGEDESDGGMVWRQPWNNGGVVVRRGSVVGHSAFPCGGDTGADSKEASKHC